MEAHNTIRSHEDQNMWNFILSLFFLAVFATLLFTIYEKRGGFPQSIPVFDAILIALASFRITRLMVYDKITRWFRELFVSKKIVREKGVYLVEITPIMRGMRGTMRDLLECPWCIGFWAALIVVYMYFMFSWAWIVIFFLAAAGAGLFLQITANAVGWVGENKKLDAAAKKHNINIP